MSKFRFCSSNYCVGSVGWLTMRCHLDLQAAQIFDLKCIIVTTMDNSRYSNASWELRDHSTFRRNGRWEASISSKRINGCFNNILSHQWEFSTSQSDCEGMNYILSHKQRNRSLNAPENYLVRGGSRVKSDGSKIESGACLPQEHFTN